MLYSANSTAHEVIAMLEWPGILIKFKTDVTHKMEKKCILLKNKEVKVRRENLEDLFDIAHAHALLKVTVEEDGQFLVVQGEKA